MHIRRKVDLILMRDIDVRPRKRAASGNAPGRISPLEFHHNNKGVERFARLDALTPDETLPRLGFLWLVGHLPTNEGSRSFLMPVISAVVRAHGYVIRMNELELITDFEMSPELGSPEARDLIEEHAQRLLVDYLVNMHPQREERLEAFARTLAETAHLPEPTVFAPGIHPFSVRKDDTLRLSAGLGLYLARDPGHITMRSTLAAWANSEITATAFGAAYGADAGVVSPFRAQAEAIEDGNHRAVFIRGDHEPSPQGGYGTRDAGLRARHGHHLSGNRSSDDGKPPVC